jgi:hypothetical protein
MRLKPRIPVELTTRLTVALAVLLSAPPAPGSPVAAAAEEPSAAPGAAGVWQGAILYEPGRTEVDIVVELAQAPDGRWTGTIDVLPHNLQYQPLDEVSVEGSKVSFVFVRQSPTAGRVESPFEGELSADGITIRGDFLEGRKNRYDFVLKRIGEPGEPRPEPRLSEVHPLSEDATELRETFNRDSETVRVVMLLSPT